MAVAPTGAIYKALEFDGVSSRTYGVYITGEAVYNAPERDVEMITIPGRSGSFALDNGRFENITVTYPAGIFAETEAEFREAISEFRNFLCSRKGYVRLQDEYNPDEYRMAVYKSGLEVEPVMLKAGEFEITFDCKPQRWLTSGETAIDVTSGDTITNPTLFEASPLLEVTGNGDINLGDELIQANISTLGWGIVGGMTWDKQTGDVTYTIENTDYYNAGDDIKVDKLYWNVAFGSSTIQIMRTLTLSFGGETGSGYYNGAFSNVGFSNGNNPLIFSAGTASTKTYTLVVNYNYTASGTAYSGTATLVCTAVYDGDDTIVCSCAITQSGGNHVTVRLSLKNNKSAEGFDADIQANSSKMVASGVFIDLDIGEAYTVEGGTVSSLNDSVTIPAKMPTIKSGATTITFDNTITDLKVTPRWWKV